MQTSKQPELSALVEEKLLQNYGTDRLHASNETVYKAMVSAVRDIMKKRRTAFVGDIRRTGSKRVYYLSMEFLMGRSLKTTLFNLGLADDAEKMLKSWDIPPEDIYACEPDAGLGNGGLGRLAACFLDSLTCGGYAAMGYCIKYEFGIFRQKIVDGWQTEVPDCWLPGGEVWLESRPDDAVDVRFGGHVEEGWNGSYHTVTLHDSTAVRAVPYDLMIAGDDGRSVNLLRLWSAEAPQIDMAAFNRGEYVKSQERRAMAEVISKVLYPEDNHPEGKSLRLRQQYFLVSASVQDILARHLKQYGTLDNLPDKAAIHINDTHPALAIPELMRILLDECGYGWDEAWNIVTSTVAYTNHTVMKEALECWNAALFRELLPRVYTIIEEIDRRYRAFVIGKTGDPACAERTAVISGGTVRMANLCVAACHRVNGVSQLHSDILKKTVFSDFYNLTPEKFTNVTNGISFRRWLYCANPELTRLLRSLLGDGFMRDTAELSRLNAYAGDTRVLEELRRIKRGNKERFAAAMNKTAGISIDCDSIFDMQVKRLHEYKRQHLNAMHIISEYLYLKDNPNAEFTPKTYIFGAKAAAGYMRAKKIIQLIVCLSREIESDPAVRDRLKVVFAEDYSVSLAELMIPAADFSEQISLASTEASGTGNMKMMLNGAVTIGTEDGANVEIHNAVGDENILIFGLRTEDVLTVRQNGYRPRDYYERSPELRRVIDKMRAGIGGVSFADLADYLLSGDDYLALADFEPYRDIQKSAADLYSRRDDFTKVSLKNIAAAGIFSSDRAVAEYAQNIWNAAPVYGATEKKRK